MITAAVVPVKQLENAKQRLSDVLTPDERNGLVRTMVEDVLTALRASDLIDRILVVTKDPAVMELAATYDAEVMLEPEQSGLIPAVTEAGRLLSAQDVDTMLFVPGDIPLLGTDELAVVLNGTGISSEPEFVIVPASDFGGSNCVVCSPPDCMAFGFGEDSFRRHLGIARTLGIEPVVAKLPDIGLDVDTVDDLIELTAELENRQIDTKTHRFLRDSGIIDRLSPGLLQIG
ncbi:MAG: 2-phospho-L-lactate guanylyltransferase [Pseudomonadales bacterium]